MHEPHDEPGLLEPARLFAALQHGARDLPPVLPPRDVVVAAAGTWGRYGSVVVLRRDWEEDNALLDDVYLLERSSDGQWPAPDGSSGSGMPEWVLDRPDGHLPGTRDGHLVNLGAQMANVGGCWLAELTVMASRAVTTIEVRYGNEEISVRVPASGLVTLPGLVRSPDDVAEFRGFDDAGSLRGVERYRPLGESDRRWGWPDASLWAS
ncbi:hypothetical protein Ade02nite_05800 [Paractinoplanes deccanensis]|uniref:Uncharacterized protein n=1 Tax=Paractinoplanes deccanensis TaxID=113561 RepID=A0ABQ3XW29_9ACTN|nr:hypothetical protein [Actinoplanes deccanensis]GID71939.1 hypothetical protein Ade02nite_05800 [Actinoplanes deccanensis]